MARLGTTNAVVFTTASGDTTGCRAALATLCDVYRCLVCAFVPRNGTTADDAEEQIRHLLTAGP